MSRARLVGDGVENPANATALLDAAAMFGIPCVFRDSRKLGTVGTVGTVGTIGTVGTVGTRELLDGSAPIVTVENTPDAVSVFTATLPGGPRGRPSIVVGNERRGIRPDLLRAATTCVQIPMSGRGVNTLNVAAAAAVAMYYLLGTTDRRSPRTSRPETHRPSVLLSCPGDHVEAGSALRSAAACGWRSVGVDDRHKVWFGTPRSIRTEGRAAARSHRNPLRVLPMPAVPDVGFSRVIVAGTRVDGPALQRVNLTGGPNTLLVIPDEGAIEPHEDWRRLGGTVEFARIALPAPGFPYRFRLIASIVLAEASRQLGGRRSARPGRQPLTYESALPSATFTDADLVTPHELEAY